MVSFYKLTEKNLLTHLGAESCKLLWILLLFHIIYFAMAKGQKRMSLALAPMNLIPLASVVIPRKDRHLHVDRAVDTHTIRREPGFVPSFDKSDDGCSTWTAL